MFKKKCSSFFKPVFIELSFQLIVQSKLDGFTMTILVTIQEDKFIEAGLKLYLDFIFNYF